ncbi:hypothetical protein K435DRAFT_796615 [Dendrothele bispora CBS 962.96]|uniref:Uncharacterized protein n=1 Tax=Dendrothele bispora (strain CBS 962.96) TaxID=1314807 RepID=A0A4S8M523_DENBC|nr:hypothetical protein K435DRAFT_796615 [Dendrothele bispora CBS 962.96]
MGRVLRGWVKVVFESKEREVEVGRKREKGKKVCCYPQTQTMEKEVGQSSASSVPLNVPRSLIEYEVNLLLSPPAPSSPSVPHADVNNNSASSVFSSANQQLPYSRDTRNEGIEPQKRELD